MSVHNGFTIEIYGFSIVSILFWHMPLIMLSLNAVSCDGGQGRGLGG